MKLEDVLRLIAEGENEKIEFKRKPDAISEEVCAMANSGGGYIIVGVDDDRSIVGVSRKDLDRIWNQISILRPVPNVKIHEVKIDKKLIFVIEVKGSKELITTGKNAYIRIGTTKRALDIEEIIQRLSDSLRISFDKLKTRVRAEKIKKEYFEFYLRKREEIRRIRRMYTDMGELVRIGCAFEENGEYYLTNAGVLFFLEDPSEIYPYIKVMVGWFDERFELIKQREFLGPIWKQVEDSVSYIISNLDYIEIRVGARRERILEYPELAIREAITNAVIHRNYFVPSEIFVMILPSKIIVRSPGRFPPTLNLDRPVHIPRNPVLCKLMYDIGMIEKYGTGIIKMKRECDKHPFVDLRFEEVSNCVEVTFEKSIKGDIIDEKDRVIIAMIKEGKRIKDICEKLGISRQAVSKRIKNLVKMGVIKKVGRGKYVVL